MMQMVSTQIPVKRLNAIFGDKLQMDVSLARYTAARVGGPADALLTVNSVDELSQAVKLLWELKTPFFILGGGSNILVSDAGWRGLALLNRARQIDFDDTVSIPSVWAASGANFGNIARKAAARGLSGLEWAAGIPGTVGGAVFGNAGAHGSDVAACLVMAEILHRNGVHERLAADELGFDYRSSRLKRADIEAVILSARFALTTSAAEAVQQNMEQYSVVRHRTQPPGASMGSMFKNPTGDYAGRLIEQAGLKGTRVGDAEISTLHANFFINYGEARAQDIHQLIVLARQTVEQKFGVWLELEIELLGDFNE